MATIKHTRSEIVQLALLVGLLLFVRIVYVDVYLFLQSKSDLLMADLVSQFFSNIFLLLLSVLLDIGLAYMLSTYLPYGNQPSKRLVVYMLSVIAISLVGTVVANHAMLFGGLSDEGDGWVLLFSCLTITLINALLVLFFDLFFYFRQSRRAIVQEQNKKRKAQYQYEQLKQQLNPHFLFNSLNILDYLVLNGDTQRASDFIKKLAAIYRYLLRNGERDVVTLEEELLFVEKYTDLLKERFTQGFHVKTDIPELYRTHDVIPCGLQILVENAIKHNVVSQEHPLVVELYIEEDYVVVRNNLQPRITQTSMGVGLTNIKKQYQDIARKSIIVHRTQTTFEVKLPLLG